MDTARLKGRREYVASLTEVFLVEVLTRSRFITDLYHD